MATSREAPRPMWWIQRVAPPPAQRLDLVHACPTSWCTMQSCSQLGSGGLIQPKFTPAFFVWKLGDDLEMVCDRPPSTQATSQVLRFSMKPSFLLFALCAGLPSGSERSRPAVNRPPAWLDQIHQQIRVHLPSGTRADSPQQTRPCLPVVTVWTGPGGLSYGMRSEVRGPA